MIAKNKPDALKLEMNLSKESFRWVYQAYMFLA